MKRHSQPTFFIDRSLGKRIIAESLRAAGFHAEVHDDHFAADAPDNEWLLEVGKRGWIVLTKDKRFRHRTLEVRAIASSGAAVFNLTAGELRGMEMAQAFVKAAPRISRFVTGNKPPFIARVDRSGKVTMAIAQNVMKRYAP